MSVYGLIGQVHGMLIVKRLDAEDGSGDKFGDGAATCIHEGGGKDLRDGDVVSVATYGGVQGDNKVINAGGVSDESKCRPRGYLMI